jgi:heptose I phosphotransferase
MNPLAPNSNPISLTRLAPERGDPVWSFWRLLRRRGWLVRRQPDWDRFAGEGWPERIMEVELTDREHRKQGRSIGRKVFHTDEGRLSVYLKRHFQLSRFSGLLATLSPGHARSPGLQEWQRLKWAEANGFTVPRAVAAGQFIGPWGKLQGFIAIEELHGMLPLHEAIPLASRTLDPHSFARWKRGLVAELARVARELHGRRVFHKDLYFCHFYIPETLTQGVPANWTKRVVMIDLHRLSRHALTGSWWQVKDLAQLGFSSEVEGVTPRDRARFWKLYRQGWPNGGAPGEWLRPLVEWKWRLYRGHNRRKPSSVPYDGRNPAADGAKTESKKSA